jgi:hypothetical protein
MLNAGAGVNTDDGSILVGPSRWVVPVSSPTQHKHCFDTFYQFKRKMLLAAFETGLAYLS